MFQDTLLTSGPERYWGVGGGRGRPGTLLSAGACGLRVGVERANTSSEVHWRRIRNQGHDPALKDYDLAWCVSLMFGCTWVTSFSLWGKMC